jgi:hypothetical protein
LKKTFQAQSGHALYVESISYDQLPNGVKRFKYISNYPKLYVVKNWDEDGVVFMYLGTGKKGSAKEIVVWYRNGNFWSGFGTTIEDAINGAQKDGWMFA